MKRKYLSINGVEFEDCGIISGWDIPSTNSSFKRLEECYIRPSEEKIDIFYKWSAFFGLLDKCCCFGVRSFNVQQFSIHSLCEFGGKKFYFIITKAHNKIYRII